MKTYRVKITSRAGHHLTTVYQEGSSYMNAMNDLRVKYPYEVFTLLGIEPCEVCE